MGLIKKIFEDKVRVAVATVCLFMLSVVMVSVVTKDTYAATTNICVQCYADSTIIKSSTSLSADEECPSGYHYVSDDMCSSSSVVENKKYTVTLDPNGGNVPYSTFTVNYGGTYSGLPTPTRSGYKFDGWYTAETGGSLVTSSTKVTKTSDHTLYAMWTQNSEYTVTLDPNGGNLNDTTITVYQGGIYGTLPTPTRIGYEFDGWYTSKDGGTKVYSSTPVSSGNAHTLYAHWKGISLTVTLDVNGGNVPYSTFTVNYGGTYSSLPTPTRSGYEFDGWYSAKTGGIKVTTSTVVSAMNDHTLYAMWTQNKEYTVTLDPNGGILSDTTITVYQGGVYGTLPTPTRTGYKFDGWYTSKDGGTKVYSSTTVSKSSEHTLYAHWGDVCYKCKSGYIYYWGNEKPADGYNGCISGYEIDNTKTTEDVCKNVQNSCWKCLDGSGYVVSPNRPSSDYGYSESDSFNTTSTGCGSGFEEEPVVSSYCSGSFKKDDQGSSGDSDYDDDDYDDDDSEGGDSDGSNEETSIIYYIKYNSNGGTGTMNNSKHTYGESKKLSSNSFTREGYEFTGWNTKADGSGIRYSDGQLIKDLTSTNGEIVNLYAQWKSNDSSEGDNEQETLITYSVKYNANGGTGTMSNSKFVYGEANNLKTNAFTKNGYVFVGWNTKADGTGTSYTDGQTVSNLSSTNGDIVNLYAQWKVKPIDNGSNGDDNIDESPKTGSLSVILVSMIAIGTLVYLAFYYRKVKFNNEI